MLNSTSLVKNIGRLTDRIRQACARAGRRPEEVRCVAVSKGHPSSAVRLAVESGLTDIGENRVQEAVAKISDLPGLPVSWHLIGTLQTNKSRLAVRHFSMIQSVDRLELAKALQQECEKQNQTKDVLIQVEATGEPTKHGATPEDVSKMAAALKDLGHLRLRGIMTIGPLTEDRQKIRDCFRAVHELFRSVRPSAEAGQGFDTLSMGMSDDFEIAVEEGSTLIRIGTLIFGPRPQK